MEEWNAYLCYMHLFSLQGFYACVTCVLCDVYRNDYGPLHGVECMYQLLLL